MKTLILTLSASLLTAAVATAQNADLRVVHGIPGLTAPVDVVANGTTVFSGVTFGAAQSASVAPGTYVIDIVQGGTVLLSGNATLGADESFTAVAHLVAGGGGNTLSVFQNDLSAPVIPGNGRIILRQLSGAPFVIAAAESTGLNTLTFLGAGEAIPFEVPAGDYVCQAEEITPTSPFPFNFSVAAASTGSQPLAADEGLTVTFVGVPMTPSFLAITERFSLPGATTPPVLSCDLTVSGTLPGGSLSAGGTLDFSLTNAGANDFVMVLLSQDNTPSMAGPLGNLNLGIGGSNSDIIPFAFGGTDATGNYSVGVTFPALPGLPGTSPVTFDVYAQAVSILSFPFSAFTPSCISDVETFQISIP